MRLKKWLRFAPLLLAGCSLLPISVRQELPVASRSYSSAIPPGAGLPPRAAKLQDSLRNRLEWLAPRLAEDAPYIERLAFEERADSSIGLSLRMTDANGWNSHLHDSAEIARLERCRWQKRMLKKWPEALQEAGLSEWPLRWQMAYRHHDAQWGRSDWKWDTLRVQLGDTISCREK